MTNTNEWEGDFYILTKTMDGQYRPQLLLFIKKLLNARTEEVIEMVEGIKVKEPQGGMLKVGNQATIRDRYADGWNEALMDLLTALRSSGGEK